MTKIDVTIICIVCIYFFSCGHMISEPEEQPPVINTGYHKLAMSLEKAYEEDSGQSMILFFLEWDNLLPAYSKQKVESLNDTLISAYHVFTEFYSPTNLSRITGGQHENFETDFQYVIVQNNLEIAVSDTNPQYYFYRGVENTRLTIEDFRPEINAREYPSVFLSSSADSVIFHFLFTLDSLSRDDHNNRVRFLRQFVQLTHHHWIADYHKVTMPYIFSIVFDQSLTQAFINFRVFYQFGDAYLEKSDGEWKLIYSYLTAIE